MSIGDQRAFPIPIGGYLTDVGHKCNAAQFGMTYRQWLVGMALQGLLANEFTIKLVVSESSEDSSGNRFARMAITAADAVIVELEKQK